MYFAFSAKSNRDFQKFFKIISLRVLVKLQTDIVSAQSLSNFYDELLISRIFFSITRLNVQKQPFTLVLQKVALRNFTKIRGKHLCRTLCFNKVASPRPAIW